MIKYPTFCVLFTALEFSTLLFSQGKLGKLILLLFSQPRLPKRRLMVIKICMYQKYVLSLRHASMKTKMRFSEDKVPSKKGKLKVAILLLEIFNSVIGIFSKQMANKLTSRQYAANKIYRY